MKFNTTFFRWYVNCNCNIVVKPIYIIYSTILIGQFDIRWKNCLRNKTINIVTHGSCFSVRRNLYSVYCTFFFIGGAQYTCTRKQEYLCFPHISEVGLFIFQSFRIYMYLSPGIVKYKWRKKCMAIWVDFALSKTHKCADIVQNYFSLPS